MSEGPSGSPAVRPLLPPIPAVLLSILSITGGAALAKSLFPVLGAAGTAGLRISLAALVLLTVFRPPVRRFTGAQWRAVLPYGVTLGAMNLCFYLSIARIPPGLAITLEFLGPLVLAVLGSRHFTDFVWVVLAAVGIVLLAPWSGRADAIDLVGVLLALLAGAFWAGYIVLGGRVSRLLPHGQGVAVGMGLAALTALPFTAGDLALAHFTLPLLAKGLGVAVLSSALPYTLEMMALHVLPSRTFGILMSVEPAAGALMGLLFLGERLSLPQCVAILCVCAASAGSTLTSRKTPPPVEA